MIEGAGTQLQGCQDIFGRPIMRGDYVVGAKRGGGSLILGIIQKRNRESYTVIVDPTKRKSGDNIRQNIYLKPDSVLILAGYDKVIYDDDGEFHLPKK